MSKYFVIFLMPQMQKICLNFIVDLQTFHQTRGKIEHSDAIWT